MGAGYSRQSGELAEITHSWALNFDSSTIKYASGASLESYTHKGKKFLGLAFQASESAYECNPSQHLRFMRSTDGGETWTPSRCVMWGLGPIWGPALLSDAGKLYLFYSESRKAYSPGGDVKFISSADGGETWGPPATIYTHEDEEEVPKVTANRPAVGKDGTWYLPMHREPAESFKAFSAKSFNGRKEGDAPSTEAPPGAPAQGITTSAGLLVSKDKGKTWKVAGNVEDAKTWLIEPAVEETAGGKLLMLFRTAAGKVYSSTSADKGKTWSRAGATSLANPNSKFSTVTIDGQILAVLNPVATSRSSLNLVISVDGGRSWETLAAVDEEAGGNLLNPTLTEWTEDTVKVAYTVWGAGIKVATVKLATVEAA